MPTTTKKTELIPAVIYARYSSHSQQDQSIDGQLRDCHAFAEREGYLVVSKYIDRALSAKTDDRPDFQRMIGDAQKKQFRAVIVWKLDRFARNRYDSAIYKSRLKKHGVKVVSATENITDNPEGIILEGMLESMAEYYSANLSQNVKRGQKESVSKGQHLGGIPPIGFKIDKETKKLVIDKEKAPIIQYAFEQYAKGIPKKQIIAELSAKGIKNYYGRPLGISSFSSALRNKKYIGIYMYGGVESIGACPALIDEKLFNDVQVKLTARSHAPASKKARNDYLLQGKAYCGMCGARIVGESGRSRTGDNHYYYACGCRKRRQGCKKKNEKKGFLEWYVVEQTLNYVLTPERIDYIASRIVAAYDDEFSADKIKELEARLMRLDGNIAKAVDASLEAPDKVRSVYYSKVESLEAQKTDIEVDLSRLRIASGIRYTEKQVVDWLRQFCKGDILDEDFQQRIIDVFINSIYVYDDKIIIYYNIKDSKQVSYVEMLESSEEPPGGDTGNVSGSDFKGNALPNKTLTIILRLLGFCFI